MLPALGLVKGRKRQRKVNSIFLNACACMWLRALEPLHELHERQITYWVDATSDYDRLEKFVIEEPANRVDPGI